ncbi:hypothetical protein PgNI_10522 [Pyricularia grisea]|uniref:Ribosomal protein s17 n=1 Tax=Pyricularia grisea TaxID=148305 RepID=A0A6P8AYK1_PYRGI|nr:hypothetical protein PgNI_10522 [Pyricularia grisea]TLD07438.1 hypothetical protein PgNI_10522 [Pyricularia grisea]
MLMKTALVALMGMTAMVEATILPVNAVPMGLRLEGRQNRGKNNNNNNNGGKNNNNNNNGGGNNNNNNGGGNNNNNNNKCLQNNVLNTASESTGQQGTVEAGQVESKTDNANFINFCANKVITNGEQNRAGSCNPIVMGEIPAATKMVSTVITNPKNGDKIPAQQSFNVQLKIANMKLGSFTNAQKTYYTAPQQLEGGVIVGHTHVTIQDMGGNQNPTQPLNAEQFAFFKGINDAGDGNGGLQAAVDGGLPAGNYRLCSMAGASNHQPVMMPVAQRGAQDDCVRFEVVNGGGGGGNNNGNNNGNNAQGKNNGNNGNNNAQGKNNGNQNSAQGKNNAQGKNANNGKGKNVVGAASAPAIEDSGDSARPFRVNGETFVNRAAAVQRSCAIQNNACSDAVNSGGGGSLEDCRQQEQACNANA